MKKRLAKIFKPTKYDPKKIEAKLWKKYGKFGNYIRWNFEKTKVKIVGKLPKEALENIPKTEFDESYRYKFLLAHNFIEENKLHEAVYCVTSWVERELFKGQSQNSSILKEEILLFLKEIESGHYIPAAIMVGRVLEFLSFSLTKILDIKTETAYLTDLDQLRNKFEMINDFALKFEEAKISNDQNKRKHYKTKISQTSKDITNKLHDFVTFMDDASFHKNKTGEKTYRYLDRLIKEILKKYRHIEGVEHVHKRLKQYDYIKKLREIRNKAAHAPTNRSDVKISKQDVLHMLANFVYIVEEMMAFYILIKRKGKL